MPSEHPTPSPSTAALVDTTVDSSPAGAAPGARIGYVLKMYPRFSETFVLHEMLAREAHGEHLEVFSLRLPVDGHFHAELSRLRAPVRYLPRGRTAGEVWDATRIAHTSGLMTDPTRCAELLAAPPDVAVPAVALAVAVRRRGITHLHAHFATVATDVARLAARLADVPYPVTTHAKDIFHDDVADADLARRLGDAAAVIAISDHNLDHLRRTQPHVTRALHRVRNGIDLAAFPFTDPVDRSPHVVAVGRLVEKKGFDTLLDAVALLRRAGVEVPVTIAGDGPLADDLAARIAAGGLDGVTLLGPMPQHEVRALVGSAAVFAAPCRVGADGNRDGLPTVLLEAMALGTPCVGTPVTGIPEAVVHDTSGLLVPSDDPAALASALHRLLGDAPLRSRLARAARTVVEQEFDLRRQAARMAAVTAGSGPDGPVPAPRPGDHRPAPSRSAGPRSAPCGSAAPSQPTEPAPTGSAPTGSAPTEVSR